MRERRIAVMDRLQRVTIRFWAAVTVSCALTSAVAAPLTARALDARQLASGVGSTDTEPAEFDDWHDVRDRRGDDDDGEVAAPGAPTTSAAVTTSSTVRDPTTTVTSKPTTTSTAVATTAGGPSGTTTVPTTRPPTTAPPVPPPDTTTPPPPMTSTTTAGTSPILGGINVLTPDEDAPALAVELWMDGGDAVEVPVTDAACADGGWRDYEVGFTDEGQCVAFVEGIDPTIAARVEAGLPLTDLQLASIELQLDVLGLLDGLLGGVFGLLG